MLQRGVTIKVNSVIYGFGSLGSTFKSDLIWASVLLRNPHGALKFGKRTACVKQGQNEELGRGRLQHCMWQPW